jgi:threonylcarbamoyladenosine tRNA methylthiotransferase MtaB
LTNLLEKLLELSGNFRLHLSSISPLTVDERLADILQSPKMVKHLSLSMQSGSASVLKKMNRRYTPEDYMKKIELVRKKISRFNFTTDVIVGFPGETDADFEATCTLVRDAEFSHVHVFRYSPRSGTKAFEMNDNVTEQIKSKRSKVLINQCTAQKKEYYRLFDGSDSIFLNERTKNGISRGFNEYYIPVETTMPLKQNEFFQVRTKFSDRNNILVCNVI